MMATSCVSKARFLVAELWRISCDRYQVARDRQQGKPRLPEKAVDGSASSAVFTGVTRLGSVTTAKNSIRFWGAIKRLASAALALSSNARLAA